jgi:hypothetical protein
MIWAAIGYPFGAIYKDGRRGRDAPIFQRITGFESLGKEGIQYDAKRPRHLAGPFDSFKLCCLSDRLYVSRTWAFLALSDLEFDLLAFIERRITRRLNF